MTGCTTPIAAFGVFFGAILVAVGFVVGNEVGELAGLAVSVAGVLVILLGLAVILLGAILEQLR